MSSASLISNSFSVPRDAVRSNALLIGFDAGGSLLKVVFVSKEDARRLDGEAEATVLVHSRVYRLDDYKIALQEMKECCYFPKAGMELKVTGVWSTRWRDEIEDFLQVKVRFVDEIIVMGIGVKFLLEKPSDDMFFPDVAPNPDFDPSDVPTILERRAPLLQQMTVNNHDGKAGVGPANFLIIGSATNFVHVDANGKFSDKQVTMFGGQSFIGLAKLLLGTGSYDEIMSLASQGNQNHIDVTVGDWAPGGLTVPLPLFPFGKLFDQSGSVPRREDLAASLVFFFAHTVFMMALHVAERTGVSRFFVTGNWVHSEYARQSLARQWSLLHPAVIEFKFLKKADAGALGVLLIDSDVPETMYMA